MWFQQRRIYLDYASAPPVVPEAIAAMREAQRFVGNPGALHAEGVAAKKSLEASRAAIATLIGCKARELIFTSGLTEANNLAIVGFARALEQTRRSLAGTHWIVSSIEHDSVLSCFGEIERLGGTVTHIDPDTRGIITPEVVRAAIRPETVFVSIGWANNEIGTIQPLPQIARKLRESETKYDTRIVLHADAGQAPLYRKTVIESLGVDLLALGGNKLYGPHGIGALVARKSEDLAPIMFGGKQENGNRPGTEDVALAAGFAAAYQVIADERDAEASRLKKLRDELARELVARIPDIVVNGNLDHALPHMLNISIPNISSEYLALALDAAGIAVSTKSACREGEESRSHVIYALGDARNASSSVVLTKEERAQNTVRISLGRQTVAADIHKIIREVVRLTAISRVNML